MSNAITQPQTTHVSLEPLAFYTGGAVTIDRPPTLAVRDVYKRTDHVVRDTRRLLAQLETARSPRSPTAKMFDAFRASLDKVGKTGFVGGWLVMFGGVAAYPTSDPGYYFVFGGIAGLFASVGCLHASLHALPFEKRAVAQGVETKAAEVVEKLQAHIDALGVEERIVLGPTLDAAIARLGPAGAKLALAGPAPSVEVDDVYRRAKQTAELADALRTNRVQPQHVSQLHDTLAAASDAERDIINAALAELLATSPSPYRNALLKTLAPPSTG